MEGFDQRYREPADLGAEHLEQLVRLTGREVARAQARVTAACAAVGVLAGVVLAFSRLQGSALWVGGLLLAALGAGFGVLLQQWLQPVVLPRLVERAARGVAHREGVPAGALLNASRATFL